MKPPFGIVEETLPDGRGHYFVETGEMYSTAGLFPPLPTTAPNKICTKSVVEFVEKLYDAIDEGRASKYCWTFVLAASDAADDIFVRIEIDNGRPSVSLNGNCFDEYFEASVNLIAVVLDGLKGSIR